MVFASKPLSRNHNTGRRSPDLLTSKCGRLSLLTFSLSHILRAPGPAIAKAQSDIQLAVPAV